MKYILSLLFIFSAVPVMAQFEWMPDTVQQEADWDIGFATTWVNTSKINITSASAYLVLPSTPEFSNQDIIYVSSTLNGLSGVLLPYQLHADSGDWIAMVSGVVTVSGSGGGASAASMAAATDVAGVTRGTFTASASEWIHYFPEGYALDSMYTQALTIGGAPWNHSMVRIPRVGKPGQDTAVLARQSGMWSTGTGFSGFLQVTPVEDIDPLPEVISTAVNVITERLVMGVLQ